MSAKKRSRAEPDESQAECPFKIRGENELQLKQKKRKKGADGEEEVGKKLNQLSPFAPFGKFKLRAADADNKPRADRAELDMEYAIEPAKKWSEMTRYNSFVLNGVKYFSEGFIFVANDTSIEAGKAPVAPEKVDTKDRSKEDWVARILEIRASDEHHVYARVYWMYWPDELPAHTVDGKKYPAGRQSYHGQMELVASNHMDIINVVSVTAQAQVNQMIEDNDDDVQAQLYWRQAYDVRTLELSTVDTVCKCQRPANPDKTLIGCNDENCHKWLHAECLKEDILLKTFERLGKSTPHVLLESAKKEEEADDEAKPPLSPKETGGAVSAQQSIDVNPNGESESTKNEPGKVDVENGNTVGTPAKSEEPVLKTQLPERAAKTRGVATPKEGKTPAKKRKDIKSEKPYEGMFAAELLMALTPPRFEIKDLREGIEGGAKTWLEPINCLLCGTQVD